MLQPARTKYRKQQKGRNTGVATRGAKVSFGEYGLKATTRGRLTARQLEAARRAMSRHIKRGGRIWIRVFPDKPVAQKPAAGKQVASDGVEPDALADLTELLDWICHACRGRPVPRSTTSRAGRTSGSCGCGWRSTRACAWTAAAPW